MKIKFTLFCVGFLEFDNQRKRFLKKHKNIFEETKGDFIL